ncbi:hypothetical protein LTS18_000686 [Coniosporium uncinatum]|uniref:Uncharacterized protein n=1 Tax=Coniosporium uncinatum TaxID=93489 RepID=A0ACC3CTT5_9PEZI|nr:hypothetical protein LTS18_000686 [Coniosporium uncinatum]
MAQNQQQGQQTLVNTFPTPPPFYKYFTSKNLARVAQVKDQESHATTGEGTQTSLTAKILDLPPELRYLIPPEPPVDGVYRNFGQTCNINAPLPSLSDLPNPVEQLYPSPPSSPSTSASWTFDRALYLKKISRSILLNFLELIGILATNPDEYEAKTDNLNTLFTNAHQLINEYRPHQARESLILMMEESIEGKRKEVEEVRLMKGKVEKLMGDLGNKRVENGSAINGVSEESIVGKRRQERQAAAWDALEEELGSD